jgi:hypothetical protein
MALNKEKVVALIALLIAVLGLYDTAGRFGRVEPVKELPAPEKAAKIDPGKAGVRLPSLFGSDAYDPGGRNPFIAQDIWHDARPSEITPPPPPSEGRPIPGRWMADGLVFPRLLRIKNLPSAVPEADVTDPDEKQEGTEGESGASTGESGGSSGKSEDAAGEKDAPGDKGGSTKR